MTDEKLMCGVVLPISAIEDCTEAHWTEVLDIHTQAIESAGFEANVVSNSDEVGVIHKRIIQNLYDNPIVVVDVSAKNPNVMFELGMRLAFDKPTIVVKDDQTFYSFDTSAIEHIEYPRDLRFSQIIDFKEKLARKIEATYRKSMEDKDYTTFLKHFGEFKVAKIDETEVSGQEYLLEEMRSLRKSVARLETTAFQSRRPPGPRRTKGYGIGEPIDICLKNYDPSAAKKLLDMVQEHPGVREMDLDQRGQDHYHLVGFARDSDTAEEVKSLVPDVRVNRAGAYQRKRKS